MTFTAHREVISAEGRAILGKLGKALGVQFVNILNNQIGQGIPVYLFLTTREGWNGPYVTYQCQLECVHMHLSKSELSLVPTYYAADQADINTWFEISTLTKMSRQEMNRIYALSSGRAIMSVVNSSASVFRVGLTADQESS